MTHTALAADEPEPHDMGYFTPTLSGDFGNVNAVGVYKRTGATVSFSVWLDPVGDPIRTTAWVDQPKAIEA